jgi:hypothetical protein
MTRAPSSFRQLSIAAVLALLLVACGAIALYFADMRVKSMRAAAQQSTAQRVAANEKLSRATMEEGEIRHNLVNYEKLRERGVIGVEHRLDWVDSIADVRERNKLPDMRYAIAPQQPLDYPGLNKTAEVEALSSPLTLDMGLLHEGDLFRVLADLRHALPPYFAVRECDLQRVDANATGHLAARLRAHCVIDLITIRDRAQEGAARQARGENGGAQ